MAWDKAQIRAALALAATVGIREAARQSGIPAATLHRNLKRNGAEQAPEQKAERNGTPKRNGTRQRRGPLPITGGETPGLPETEPPEPPDALTDLAPKKAAFLRKLAEFGIVTLAAEAVGVSRQRAYQWRDADEDFALLWEQAVQEALDRLEGEARRRAYDGVDKPVYYKGERIDTIREYSDTLLIFLLNGGRPEKFKQRHELTGKGGGAIQVNHTIRPAHEVFAQLRAMGIDPGAPRVPLVGEGQAPDE